MKEEEAQFKNEKEIAKQATYFALYSLLEFIINVPVNQTVEQLSNRADLTNIPSNQGGKNSA
jgi:hypothetical protein